MLRKTNSILVFIFLLSLCCIASCRKQGQKTETRNVPNRAAGKPSKPRWQIPDTNQIADAGQARLIKYGRALVVNTSYYFGPSGVIAHKSNGLNCQNCHLDAGTKLNGNNFSMVATGYPRFKERSGTVETIVKKVQDCFERSLNGKRIDANSREMKAFVAYLEWIGGNVKKGTRPEGSGIEELPFLARAADTARGLLVYTAKCQVCHGKKGEGLSNAAGTGYTYPPLWGSGSYNVGASIYRLSKFAGYIRRNMPYKAEKTGQLTAEQAWDVAAFVNSRPHPYKDISADWPNLRTKPYDYPYGPYADNQFNQQQRKYGPFAPIKKLYPELSAKK